MMNLLLRAGALALCLAQPALALSAPAAPPAAASPTAAQWREDLAFMAREMERRHKNLYHTVSREAFAAAVADLDARLPAMQRHEAIVGLMRIAATVGDGHTNVSPLKDTAFGFRSLPLKLYLFEDGLYARAARPDQAPLLGARVEAVNGVPVAEAIRRVGEISPRDNAITPTMYAPIFLGMPAILHALKLSPTPETAVLTLSKGGRRWTATVPAGDVDPSWPPDTDISLVTPDGWIDARTSAPQPLWLQAPLDYHRMIELPAERALYVQLNMVTGIKGQSLADFGERIRERAAATNPRVIVLDVRLNRGGNQDLRFPFVADLIKAEDADTQLRVLSWRGAFSATQPILDDLAQFTDAVLIGEPASSRPNGYGDSYRIVLPNSGITVRTSIKYHQRDTRDRPWTAIDVATPYRFADYAMGRDPALAAALASDRGPALGARLAAAAARGGTAGALAELDAHIADPANRWSDFEIDLGAAAQRLQADKQPVAALAVARRAAARVPGSARLALIEAIIAEGAGDRALAAGAAQRALSIEPDNREARSLLVRLAKR
jgi:hypothetical protein